MAGTDELGGPSKARLTYLLKRALLDLERLHEEHLAAEGINARELALLLFLDGRRPESQQQVAERLGVDRTTMVGLVDSLESKGFVVRRPDEDDRRRNVVDTTATGARALRSAIRASDRAEAQLLTDLDDQEAAQLRALLDRVATTRRPQRGR